jgi:aromatic-amino-acid transaminase
MFANSHKRGQEYGDMIFKMLKQAQERAKAIGADEVINGTIGALLEKGSLVTFGAVDELIPRLDIKRVSAYAPLQGFPDFIEAVKFLCFGDWRPSKKIAGVAVAGGMGGIRQAIINYTEIDDEIVTSDWHWGPYDGIIEDNYRKVRTFPFFNDKGFHLEGFKEVVEDVGKKQETVFILFNSPANNPTGYSLSLQEWDGVIGYLNGVDRRVILFLDSAYLDYADAANKKMFPKLDGLGEHVLSIVGYSLSKSFAKYGMRTAALLAVHENEKALKEFEDIITISNRACFGSVNSMGQLLAMELVNDKEQLARYFEEFDGWKKRLKKRAEVFMSAVDPAITAPFKDGFFASILSDDPPADVEKLTRENIFLVPIKKGIRVGLCSIDDEKLERLATTINKVIK